MTASLLDRYLANAIIRIQTGGGLGRGSLGNPVVMGGVERQVQAYIKERSTNSSTPGQILRPQGTNEGSVRVEGRLTDPSTWAEVGITAAEYTKSLEVIIDGVKGRLLLNPTIQSAALTQSGYLAKVGESLTGWFDIDEEN